MKPQTNILSTIKISKVRKDGEYKCAVDEVIKLTKTNWVATRMQLTKRGYKTAGDIRRLLGSVSDHPNPPAMLNWILNWKNRV